MIVEPQAANFDEPRDKSNYRSQTLRPGLWMHWGLTDGNPLAIPLTKNDAAFFTFFLWENWKSEAQFSEKENVAAASSSPGRMLFFSAGVTPPHHAVQSAAFHVTLIANQSVLNDLLADDGADNFAQVQLLTAQNESRPLKLDLSSAARFNLESIRRCPFAGACRELALAARGLDLLANFITALDEERHRAMPLHSPLDHTLGQVRAAAARLQANLEHPPSLAELAGAVGLSESTLKRGFHQLYQTTPFGYLRACRLEHARELLATGKATVLEAAAYVGYSNPSNFAAAFRTRFGVNPKTFQMSARR
ncbi:MAG: AraC family transcriptional regulator [Nibricoccus sp.]